jgi:very-short-patch-repair endonuclease
MYRELYSEYKNNLQRNVKFDWCRSETTKRYYPFDFVITDLNIIIELDGLQHFEQVQNWNSPEHNLKRDVYKMKLALKHKYNIIRVFQEDVYKPSYNWQELYDCINNIKSSSVHTVYFLSSKSDLYDNHKFEMGVKFVEIIFEE